MISIIVAMDSQRVIGADNRIPWRLPDDIAWFKQQTVGKPVIMGRKTYESVPPRFRPLSGRHNIIMTRNPQFTAAGCTVVSSVAAALTAANDAPEIMIIGGAELYALFLPMSDRLYLTCINARFEGDSYFPPFDKAAWHTLSSTDHPADERHAVAFTWKILSRKISEDARL